MILFFVTEKSVIPVNGALEGKTYSLLKSVGVREGTPLGSRTMPTGRAPQQAGLNYVLCNHSSQNTQIRHLNRKERSARQKKNTLKVSQEN